MQGESSEWRRDPDVDVEQGLDSLHEFQLRDDRLEPRDGGGEDFQTPYDGFDGDFVSNKSSRDEYAYDSAGDTKTQKEEGNAPRRRHKVGRRAAEHAISESSSFRFLANFQKYRNFYMYFILSHLAGHSCVAFMGFNIVVQLAQIVLGFVFLKKCPMQPYLSTWNLCAGTAFSLKMFTAMMFLAVMRKDIRLSGGVPVKTTIYKSPRYFCLMGIVDCLLLTLLITGMTLTMPHIECMARQVGEKHDLEGECMIDGEKKKCSYLSFFFTVAVMVFLQTVYTFGYILSAWITGLFYTMGVAEEAAGKCIMGYAKLRNRSSWNIKAEDQKTLRRKSEKNRDKKKKKKIGKKGLTKKR